ncbi:hypothetical protein EST38_g6943 [Candolleomyces aberdarensis]|uniref:F-box domain-containing protein n=1 Tax=Candolleomyces aberdarensis TaxID=2316362 RepID=A0A4V1Q3K5_9AGAR|nr:hypothetical protein EST38_g6943 [Candolleomyces aberdarensis]
MLQRLRQHFKSSPQNTIHVQWSLPLPEDIIRLLVDEYLDFDTIQSLSRTCKGFVLFCRQHIFQEVRIGTPPNSPNRDKPRPTLVDIKKAIEGSPYILDFIQALRIYRPTQGITLSDYQKSRTPALNEEGKALRYILLRVKHLKDAVCAVFRLNPLEEVSITNQYPLELVRPCTALRALEYKECSDHLINPLLPVHGTPNPAISIQDLSLQDPCEVDQLVFFLLTPSSPVDLSALKTLRYFGRVPPVPLSRIFNMSASTLEFLKIFVQDNGEDYAKTALTMDLY